MIFNFAHSGYFAQHNGNKWNTHTHSQTQFLEKSVIVIVFKWKIEDHSNTGRAEPKANRSLSADHRGLSFRLVVILREAPWNPDRKKEPMLSKPLGLSTSVR